MHSHIPDQSDLLTDVPDIGYDRFVNESQCVFESRVLMTFGKKLFLRVFVRVGYY